MQIPVLVGMLSTLLAADDLVRAEDLAKKYEISTRSVYRYMAMLSEGGVPIESCLGRGGGWRIVENYKLKATYFTPDEYERLIFSLQSNALQDDVTRQAISKLTGLNRSHKSATILKSDQFIVDGGDSVPGELVNTLSDCIAQKRLCHIEYHSKDGVDSVRVIEPYCLILKDGGWYVYSFCRLRRDFRYFKVTRIVKLDVGEKFSGRSYDGVDSSVIKTDVLKGKEMVEVLLSLDRDALSACEEWLGIGAVAKMGESYLAKAELPYDEMLINKILSLGRGVRVEKPARLRLAVVERCKEIAYQNAED